MIKAPDVADLWHIGWLPAQHQEADYAPHLRTAMFMARIQTRDLYQRYVIQNGTKGDVLGFSLWGVPAKAKEGATATGPGAAAANNVQNDPTRRATGAWAGAWPAVTTKATQSGEDQGSIPARNEGGGGRSVEKAAGDSSAATVRPIWTRAFDADQRFLEKGAALPPRWPALPKDWPGIVLTGTKETSQEDLFFPLGGGPLIAVNVAGKPELASLVCDLRPDDTIDPDRKARLQTMMRVVRMGGGQQVRTNKTVSFKAAGGDERNGIAWNLAPTGRDNLDGGGIVIDQYGPVVKPASAPSNNTAPTAQTTQTTGTGTQVREGTGTDGAPKLPKIRGADGSWYDATRIGGPATKSKATETPKDAANPKGLAIAYMSQRLGGPIDVGDADDIHRHGTSLDGEPINSAHISTRALYRGPQGDAPFAFEGAYLPDKSYPFLAPVHLRFSGADSHLWTKGARPGMFRWQAEVPDYKPTEAQIVVVEDGERDPDKEKEVPVPPLGGTGWNGGEGGSQRTPDPVGGGGKGAGNPLRPATTSPANAGSGALGQPATGTAGTPPSQADPKGNPGTSSPPVSQPGNGNGGAAVPVGPVPAPAPANQPGTGWQPPQGWIPVDGGMPDGGTAYGGPTKGPADPKSPPQTPVPQADSPTDKPNETPQPSGRGGGGSSVGFQPKVGPSGRPGGPDTELTYPIPGETKAGGTKGKKKSVGQTQNNTVRQLVGPIRQTQAGTPSDPMVATTMNRTFTNILGRPTDLARGLDSRKATSSVPAGLLARIDARSPLTARLEFYGAQPATEFTRTTIPPNSRGPGGTGPGGLAIMPPEAGIEDARNRQALPSTVSVPYVTLWGARLAFGRPDTKTGTVLSGFEFSTPSTNNLTLQSRTAAGVLDASAFLKLDRSTGSPKMGFFGTAARARPAAIAGFTASAGLMAAFPADAIALNAFNASVVGALSAAVSTGLGLTA